VKGLSPVRRFVAVALALSLLSSTVSGCSQPIDTGSSVPAQSQPIVALLALIGLGIGLTALHHHNEAQHSSGSSVTVTAPVVVVTPFISGFAPADLVPNSVGNGGTGDLGLIDLPSGAGTGKYAEILIMSSGAGNSAQLVGDYSLPTGYAPQALAIDPSGNAWFDDRSGKVYECAPIASGVTTCTVVTGPLTDGLAVGPRSIGVDGNFLFITEDGGGGKVDYSFLPVGGTTFTTGSYQSSSTASIFAADAVEATPPIEGGSGYTVFHEDGSSDLVTFAVSGSSVTLSDTTSFVFSPLPIEAPSDFIQDSVTSNGAFFALTGSASATYQITRYTSAANSGLGKLPAVSVTIAANGRTGGPFVPPVTSLHADANESVVWCIDAHGNIAAFAEF
jgi:hypothetical protein